MRIRMKFAITLVTAYASSVVAGMAEPNSCNGINRSLTTEQAATFSRHVRNEFKAKEADILQIFRFRGWSILYVDTHDADEAFVFYRGDPARTHYVTVWSGAAGYNEEDEIRLWAEKNAPGIPHRLAECFAWHVTKARNM
jgi:hypothetical protein